MKSRQIFVPVILTFLITSAIFVLSYFFYLDRSSTLSFTKGSNSDKESAAISWDSASIFINDFKKSNALKVTHNGRDNQGREKKDPLQGFTMEADNLRQILDSNSSGIKPDNVIFYFGEKGKTSRWFGHGIINIFAVGIKNDTLLTDTSNKARLPPIYDHANPCPPFCPEDPSKKLN